jgi:hypothetical protein
MTSFPDFDFAPHADKLGNEILDVANGGHTSIGALLDAPELLSMLQTWVSQGKDIKRYGLRDVAELSPAFHQWSGAPAHFAKRIAEPGASRDWLVGLSLLGSDTHRSLVEATLTDNRSRLGNFEMVYVLAAQAELFPDEFTKRALAWLEQSKEEIKKWRRDSRNMHGPNEEWLQGLYAALALAPTLDPAIVKALERRTREPGAMIALVRHGHAKTIERMRDPNTFIEMHNSGDFTYGAAAVLVALGDDGKTLLRDMLLDATCPVRRDNLITAAIDLGIWDGTLTEAYIAAIEADTPRLIDAASELPLLERSYVARLEAVLQRPAYKDRPYLSKAVIEQQRETSKKLEERRLWHLSTDELTSYLGKLKTKDMKWLTDRVRDARRAGDRFVAAAAELAASKNVMTQLVIRLASRPEQRYPGSLTNTDHRAGHQLQLVERRWRPERFAAGKPATQALAAKPTTRSRAKAAIAATALPR